MPRKWLVPTLVLSGLMLAGLGVHLYGHDLYRFLLALHGVHE